jgi:hypothetical protein
MEAVASPLVILAVALSIWFLSSKQTRKSIGNSVQEGAQTVEQSLKVARAQAFAEAKAELGDIKQMLDESNDFLGSK